MNEMMLIYLLSISENFSHTLDIAAGWCLFIGAAAYVIFTVRYWILYHDKVFNDETRDKASDYHKAHEPRIRKISLTLGTLVILFWIAGALFPTTESVLRAYALIEGSKVINAENAEAAAEAVGKRFDRFLDIIDKSVNVRKEEPVVPPTQPNAVPSP